MPGAGSHLAQHGHDGLVVFGWGSGADTTAPSVPHCRRSLYRTVQHAGTHSPFPPRKRLFGPWLGRRQPRLLDPQSLPKHRLSRDIPVAHCEHQPRPHGCPERHQRHGPVAVGADVALRLCTPNGPPAAESCGPPPAPCHGTQPRGVTSPWRMASPRHGTQPHGPGTGSHERVPGAGMGKGCLGAPKWRPRVPRSHGDTCAWLGTAETAGHHGHSAPPPDARSAPSPSTRRPNGAQTPHPPKSPQTGGGHFPYTPRDSPEQDGDGSRAGCSPLARAAGARRGANFPGLMQDASASALTFCRFLGAGQKSHNPTSRTFGFN